GAAPSCYPRVDISSAGEDQDSIGVTHEGRQPSGGLAVRSTNSVRSEVRLTLGVALPPQPDSQRRQDDEGHDADPEGNADIARSHIYTEDDAKQLSEGDQPEQYRDDKRRWPLVHPNLLSRASSTRVTRPRHANLLAQPVRLQRTPGPLRPHHRHLPP